MNNERATNALLISPLATPLVFILAVAFSGGFTHAIETVSIILIFYTAFAYIAAVVFGYPMHLLFRSLGWNNAFVYLVGGALIGIIMLYLVGLLVSQQWGASLYQCLLYGGAGIASALVFWVVEYKWPRRLR